MFNKVKKISTFIGILVALLIGYQNCDQLPSARGDQDSGTFIGEANGTGYEGKGQVTYGSHPLEGRCPDGSNLQNSIKVDIDAQKAYITRSDCKEIAPVDVSYSSLDLLPHNFDNFIKDIRLYKKYVGQLKNEDIFTYCRGAASDQGTGPVVVDIKIIQVGDNKYKGRILAGKYDAEGKLLEKDDSGLVDVMRWGPNEKLNPDYAYFSHNNANDEREWHISVRAGYNTTGSMNYNYSHEKYWGSIWNFPCLRFKK